MRLFYTEPQATVKYFEISEIKEICNWNLCCHSYEFCILLFFFFFNFSSRAYRTRYIVFPYNVIFIPCCSSCLENRLKSSHHPKRVELRARANPTTTQAQVKKIINPIFSRVTFSVTRVFVFRSAEKPSLFSWLDILLI